LATLNPRCTGLFACGLLHSAPLTAEVFRSEILPPQRSFGKKHVQKTFAMP
jgi:hypothetical protein